MARFTLPGFRGIGLPEFGRRFLHDFAENDCTNVAAQLAFYFLFALFPLLFFLVTLAAYLPLQNSVGELISRLRPFMPQEALEIIQRQLDALLLHPRPKLLTLGIAATLWSASRGVDALRTALNRAYRIRESRPWWRAQVLALSMTIVTTLVVLISTAMILAGGRLGLWLADRVHVGRPFLTFWSWFRWPATALVFMLVIALLYDLLPNVPNRYRYVTPGSVISTLLWLLSTWGFTRYVDNFGKYDVTYGSIGGVMILALWLYVFGLVLVIGGEVNAVIDRAAALRGAAAVGETGAGTGPDHSTPA